MEQDIKINKEILEKISRPQSELDQIKIQAGINENALEEYTKKIIEITDRHLSKHKNKKMSVEELNKLCRV